MRAIDTLPELEMFYPVEWEAEYKAKGYVQVWKDEYPDQFDSHGGIHGTYGMLDLIRRYRNFGSLANFSVHAMMYLLLKSEGYRSLTYFELGHNEQSSTNRERRQRLQGFMRHWMGDEKFNKLKCAIQSKVTDRFGGEPDLFIWHPVTGNWYFREMKLTEPFSDKQLEWFEICRETLPGVDIRVCRMKPQR